MTWLSFAQADCGGTELLGRWPIEEVIEITSVNMINGNEKTEISTLQLSKSGLWWKVIGQWGWQGSVEIFYNIGVPFAIIIIIIIFWKRVDYKASQTSLPHFHALYDINDIFVALV